MFCYLLFISGAEIIVILLIILLLFGADKIPGIAKNLGKGINEVKRATDDIKREMDNYTDDIKKDFTDIKDEVDKTKDDLNRKDF
ncbi:MAG: twin-arginine translocase TatA/TatE family subunit [Bacteroidales bacterium]|nr:twin-arginine translocase TatA/TatE family subunit [Bacteroidales bacterium]